MQKQVRTSFARMQKRFLAALSSSGLLKSRLLFAGGVSLALIGAIALMGHMASQPAAGASNTSSQGPLQYQGIDLQHTSAPQFTLRDQTGAPISLQQFHGHPVALTFFDSVCPHQDCSLIAEYLNATAKDLGAHDTNAVAWVAISMNPWHDTPASAKAFLQTRQVHMPLHYLLGTEQQLAPLWQAFHMQVVLQKNGIVIHTTGVFLIDGNGFERTYFQEGFDPKVVSQQLHQLLTKTNSLPQASNVAGVSGAAYTASATVQDYRVAFTATPGQFGSYDFTVTAQDPSGTPVQGAHVDIGLTMPDMAMSPLDVPLPPITPPIPGSYQARGVLSMAGSWQAKVRVIPSGATQPIIATFHFTAQF
jgi:protein SCO1/2